MGQNRGVSQTPVDPENLVKSKQRVADHGEVFTPSWMVEDMLDLVKSESERIDSRFLEPACGFIPAPAVFDSEPEQLRLSFD